jgi:hypothetical protein
MTLRGSLPVTALLVCFITVSALCQTARTKSRVFVTAVDAIAFAGNESQQHSSRPIDVKRAQLVAKSCPYILVTNTTADADYFLMWQRVSQSTIGGWYRNNFAVYDRDARLAGRGVSYGNDGVGRGLCRIVREAEKLLPRRAALSSSNR